MSLMMFDTITDRAGTGSPSFPNGLTSQIFAPDGTVASPSFRFSEASGLYLIGAGRVGVSVQGTKVGEWNANGLMASSPYWKIVDQKHEDLFLIDTNKLNADKNIGDLAISKKDTKVYLYGENTIVGTILVSEGELIVL